MWYAPFDRALYPFDTVSIEDDFEPDAYSAYTLATDTGLVKYLYVADTLQSITQMDVIEIMEFQFLTKDEGILLEYSHFPSHGYIQDDRDLALSSNFVVNRNSSEIYLSEFEYTDTLKVKIMSDLQIQVNDRILKKYSKGNP